MKRPSVRDRSAPQSDHFSQVEAAAPAAPTEALVAIGLPAQALSKRQRSFNRLIEQIRCQRDLLAEWQAYAPRFHQRLANEQAPRKARLRAARLDLLQLLDALVAGRLPGPKLGKRQLGKLQSWISQIAAALPEERPDAEIGSIFDRHSDISHADTLRAEMDEAQALFGQVLGEEALRGHRAQTLDELMQHAGDHVAAQAKAQAERVESSVQPDTSNYAKAAAKARQAETARQRQDAAAQQAGQSVREIFRKLASALHPDREPEPAERQRKTL